MFVCWLCFVAPKMLQSSHVKVVDGRCSTWHIFGFHVLGLKYKLPRSSTGEFTQCFFLIRKLSVMHSEYNPSFFRF